MARRTRIGRYPRKMDSVLDMIQADIEMQTGKPISRVKAAEKAAEHIEKRILRGKRIRW